jgi:transcriptional regulator with XRE-family HTH domain
MPDTRHFAANLRRCRHEANLSQAALASRTGSPQTRISLLERGCAPADGEVERVASALGVPVAALLRRTRRIVRTTPNLPSASPSELGGVV